MIKIKYSVGVYTPAGWRSEEVIARAEPISPARCRVVEVLDVGGNGATGYASRTGANRQRYSVGAAARAEIGKIKLTGRLAIIEGE